MPFTSERRWRFSAVATVRFRDDIRLRSSTDSDRTESLSSPVRTLATSNQIIYWTRRKPCHPSSSDPDLSCFPVLSLSSYFQSLHPPAVLPLQHLTFPACEIWRHFLYLLDQLRRKNWDFFLFSKSTANVRTIQGCPFKCKSFPSV